MFVLDSWPLLEWAYGKEPAASQFSSLLDEAHARRLELTMSRINFGEVIYSCKRELPAEEALRRIADISGFPITFVSVDDPLVDEAADLKAHHRFSYADAFAAALAIRLRAPLVTGDREFLLLQQQGVIEIEWVGA